MKLPKNENKEFEIAPAGNHLAICFQVIDLGTQLVEWQGQAKKQRKIQIGWELANETMKDGRPFMVSKRYTLSSYDRARLIQDLNSWRGVPFTKEDYGNFEIQKLIGKGCLLQLIHQPSQDGSKTYCNIQTISSLPRGTETPGLVNDPIYFSLDEPDESVWDSLPDWMQEIIAKSPEYEALKNEKSTEEKTPIHTDDDVPF